jgi:tRNA-Thr(GGU) m(6)t(6)A37 methyltransferase TsaA
LFAIRIFAYFQEVNILSETLSFTPIAIVKSQFRKNTPPEEMRKVASQIIVKPEFEAGLMGLEVGADILVLFQFHRNEGQEIPLQLHPRHNPENPLTGVFNTRTQFRPNFIGATVARIKQIEGRVITVMGLDAQDDSPVLDIKPYATYFDTDTQSQTLEGREVATLQEARDAIDAIDAEIIRLFGNRTKYVHQVVNFKKHPADVPAPKRYAHVMRQRREWAEAAGLNPDIIEEMYKLLIDNYIQEELEIMHRRANEIDE